MTPSGVLAPGAVPSWKLGISPTPKSDGKVKPAPSVPKLKPPRE
ncbi:Uncharacterised protein [Mycobacteroides abscessus]|nr:Uncharacterised protein [Mycobacteroides abscessus]CPU63067.1 Uncharacterised protein [Mycobacteroides abscessus]SHX12423.1 Uncharacterised protein [Mycobacteroides abscessus subsp. abscessus]SIA48451.1 Uncharacterised protein [Mycobacteroides abscessus subsp. abscessus]SIL43434.1 Uncharacterised protein [Mycobacteroides abscessus subsp. abscessus]